MKWEARIVGQVDISKGNRIALDHAQVYGADYSGRRLSQFGAIGSRLEGCRFDHVMIDNASFGAGHEMSEYVGCSFNGARLKMGPGGYVRFVRCSFQNVNIYNWKCFAVELIDCTFTGKLKTGIFNGTVRAEDRPILGRERNEFHGNDFSGIDLIDVAFRTGIDLTQQCLPQGPEYLYLADASVILKQAQAELLDWKEPELRRVALTMIKGFMEDADKEQRQLLLRAENYYPYSTLPQEATDRLFAVLRRISRKP